MKTAVQLERAWKRFHGSFPSFIARLDREGAPYLSHSKVSEYRRCPRCYYRQYVLGEEEVSAAMRLGGHFHAAARRFYTARSPVGPGDLLGRAQTRGLAADQRRRLRNAIILLCQNRWLDHEVVAAEEPFFIDLARGLHHARRTGRARSARPTFLLDHYG